MATTPLTTEDIVRIKDLSYENAVTKLHKLAIDIEGYTSLKAILIGDITNIAYLESKEYADGLAGARFNLKGNLPSVFGSDTLAPNDYDLYSVVINGTYDSDLDETFSRGLIYWLEDSWVVWYSESFLQNQINSIINGTLFDAGELSEDFDVTTLNPLNGAMYIVTKTIYEAENAVYYKKGLISFGDETGIANQLTEESKMQKFTVGAGQTTFIITDFTLTEFELLDSGNFRGNNCTVEGQTITYLEATEGTIIKILNLS